MTGFVEGCVWFLFVCVVGEYSYKAYVNKEIIKSTLREKLLKSSQ